MEEAVRLETTRRVRPDAYEAYLQGRYFGCFNLRGGCPQAERYFQQAIALDPSFAQPHAELGFCYGVNRLFYQLSADEALAKGHAEIDGALDLDENLADAHVSLAMIRHRTEYDWPAAEHSFQRALVLAPGHAEGLLRYGEWLYLSGRVDEGLALMRQSMARVPFSVDPYNILGPAYYNVRRFQDAIDQFEKAREIDPSLPGAEPWLAQTYAVQRHDREAVAAHLEWLSEILVPERVSAALAALNHAYARSGWNGFWRKELELAEEEQRRPATVWRVPFGRRIINWRMARRYALLGDRDRALASLEAAYVAREGNLVFLKLEPFFDDLHADPRFQDLVRRVGLKPVS